MKISYIDKTFIYPPEFTFQFYSVYLCSAFFILIYISFFHLNLKTISHFKGRKDSVGFTYERPITYKLFELNIPCLATGIKKNKSLKHTSNHVPV